MQEDENKCNRIFIFFLSPQLYNFFGDKNSILYKYQNCVVPAAWPLYASLPHELGFPRQEKHTRSHLLSSMASIMKILYTGLKNANFLIDYSYRWENSVIQVLQYAPT